MLSVETQSLGNLNKQIQSLVKQVERKMTNMVRGFAYEVAVRAIGNTPLGDSEKFANWYANRTLLPAVEGIARGNWQYSEGKAELVFVAGRESGTIAAANVKKDALAYKLGDRFSILNTAPYISALEKNYSSQTQGSGILKPTLHDIKIMYSVELLKYYNKG